MSSLKENRLKANEAEPDHIKQPWSKPARAEEAGLVGQQSTARSSCARLASAHAETGQLPIKRRNVLGCFAQFALSIIKHTGRSKQEETRQTTYHKHLQNSMSSCLTPSCLWFASSSGKIFSAAPNKKIQAKVMSSVQTTYYTPNPLVCIVCSDPDSHLQGGCRACPCLPC